MLDRPATIRLLKLTWTRARKAPAWALQQWRDPAKRDRAAATATFALIGAFTLASLDYLVCGGLDWNPGGEAYAMEMAQPQRVDAPVAAAISELPPAPMLAEAALVEADYTVATEELLGGPEEASAPAMRFVEAEHEPIAIEFVEPAPRAWFVSRTAVPD